MHDPRVPETLDGWSVLHQLFRIRWPAWHGLAPAERARLAAEAATLVAAMQRGSEGTSVPVTLIGHKGDLMLIHLRRSFDELQAAQLAISGLGLFAFLEPSLVFVGAALALPLVGIGCAAWAVTTARAGAAPAPATGRSPRY